MRSAVALLALTIVVPARTGAQEDKLYSNSYKGKAPPEIRADKTSWLNTKEPLTLKGLKGRVVWLQFGWLNSAGCRKMESHLAKWHKDLYKKGLVIVGIDNGLFDTLDRLREEVKKRKLAWPILHDKEGRLIKTYGVRGYPSAYLIDVDGKVVWEGSPVRKADELRRTIEAELAKVKKENLPK